MELDDGELVKCYLSGDIDSLEILVQRYRRQLFAYILNMTSGSGDADEIFQEVWFRAIKKLHSYRQKSFLAWLIRIAHNLVIDRWRAKKPVISLDQTEEDHSSLGDRMPSKDRDPGELAINAEYGREIMSAIEELPLEQREVVIMRLKEELSFKEIAKIQKVSINTALARMQYGLSKLRETLKDRI